MKSMHRGRHSTRLRQQLMAMSIAMALFAPAVVGAAGTGPTAKGERVMKAKGKRWYSDFRKKGGVLWNKPATGRVFGLDQRSGTRLVIGGYLTTGVFKRVVTADGSQHWEQKVFPDGARVLYHDFKAGKRAAKKYGVTVGSWISHITTPSGEKIVANPGRRVDEIWGPNAPAVLLVE